MTTALAIQGLRKTYGNGFEALKGIDLQVEQGDFFALLGPNGAGKSTTLGIVSTLVRKSAGDVRVFGFDIERQTTQAKKMLGVVPQEFNFNQFETVEDIVLNQAGYYGMPLREARPRTHELLRQLGLWDKRDQRSRMLSGGMKRRLMIARALVHRPRLLILDEPTAGVDIELRRSMWDFMQKINREEGTTIILTTHYLEEAESLCRNIAIIDQGGIVENTSMRQLLRKLNTETFVLDIRDDIPQQPLPLLAAYPMEWVGEHSIQVQVNKNVGLNPLFASLSEQGLEVVSMRNKANRLEELFVALVAKSKADKEAAQ
ncbi:ABC transporter ATP-binding protein [Balneatrix alpica]|uniref:ABC transporter ATP-binding protein n=1 Tax=Balneatrix alpica TaxID=75684 RepID=A0ABV5ZEF7_9GAMM|nr:ABC transporter ATP-binding protein [Balneatrix alpica]